MNTTDHLRALSASDLFGPLARLISVVASIKHWCGHLYRRVFSDRVATNNSSAFFAPSFDGRGFDIYTEGHLSGFLKLLLSSFDGRLPIGVFHGSCRFTRGNQEKDGFEVVFRFIPRDRNGDHDFEDRLCSCPNNQTEATASK